MATGFLHQRIPNGIRKATTDYGQRYIVETAIVIAGVAGTEFKSLGSESVIKHADGRNVLNGLNWRFAAAVDAERLMLPHSLKASHLVLCLPHKSITYVENRVSALVGMLGEAEVEVPVYQEKTTDEQLVSGPQLEGDGLSQDDVNKLFD